MLLTDFDYDLPEELIAQKNATGVAMTALILSIGIGLITGIIASDN